MTLILTKGATGEGVIEDIRNLIGPPDVEQAKQESPERQDYAIDYDFEFFEDIKIKLPVIILHNYVSVQFAGCLWYRHKNECCSCK